MKLSHAMIGHLAMRFAIATQDDAKQAIVDQLGNHPVNHAEFVLSLQSKCGGVAYVYAIGDYRRCVGHFASTM